MGLVEEAISKWERVLVQEPHRQEVEGYLRQARIEVGQQTATPPAATAPAAVSDQEALDLKLRQAEHLLTLQRHEEAAFTFQQALGLAPGNARALQGLERCRKPGGRAGAADANPSPSPTAQVVSLDAQGRIAMADEETMIIAEPLGVEPPAALLKAAPAPREGLSVPERLRQATEHLPWLREPKVLVGIGGGLLALMVGLGVIHTYRKDQALKEEVRAARAAAVAPLAQQAQAPDLAESPEAIRQEAETALGTDPLRAYLRAETLVSRNGSDAAGAQLLERARAGLAGGVTGASPAEFQKHLQNGDLEAALKVMDALLRAQPGDADLRARAGRLHLALCAAHASQAKWDEAHEDLVRGRALFPGDKTWQARLKLLDRVKTLPKAQQAAWIPLLG
jgi:tetratricopeptide (TPR) repeat protein